MSKTKNIQKCDKKYAAVALEVKENHSKFFNTYDWAVNDHLKHNRAEHGVKNEVRLHDALEMMGNLHLEDKTLLCQNVRENNFKKMHRKFFYEYRKLVSPEDEKKTKLLRFKTSNAGYFESIAEQEARKRIRFITVVHAVEALDVDAALAKAQELKNEITENVKKVSRATCVGAVEIEVTSLKLLKRIRDYESSKSNKKRTDEDGVITDSTIKNGNEEKSKEYRKLQAVEILGKHLSSKDIDGHYGQFLIHFHGLLIGEKSEDLDMINEIFLLNPNWNKASRQVLFTSLKPNFMGKYQSIKESLKNIARYITKGGVTLIGSSSYLNYNIAVPKDMNMSFEEFEFYSHQDRYLKTETKHGIDKVIDIPRLSHHEINSLILVIDKMMDFDKTRTGYILRF